MRRVFVCLVTVLFVAVPAAAQPREEKGRTIKLTLHPAKTPRPRNKYRLLPKPDQQSDLDAVPLYQKAAKSLPKDSQRDQKIRQWLKTPLDKLPRKQVASTLQRLKPAIQLVEQAGKCKQCSWPAIKKDFDARIEHLSEYRLLAFTLALQARLQITQGQYDRAVGTIQTGFAMARHMSEGPAITQGLVGVAIASIMLNQVEALIQVHEAPNLYWALKNLPKPLVDLTKQMENELAVLRSSPRARYNPLLRKQFEKQLKPAHDRVRLLMKRLDRNVAMLQCVEALRLYAAVHNGKFPGALTEITKIPIPDDPVTQKPFVYRRTGLEAVLEAPAPKGATAKDAMRYQLTLKE